MAVILTVVAVIPPAAAHASAHPQAPPTTAPGPAGDATGRTPEQLQQDMTALQDQVKQLQDQRTKVLTELDRIQAQLADAAGAVEAKMVKVAAAASQLDVARVQLRHGIIALYRIPVARFGAILGSRTLNDYVVARKYLHTQIGDELESMNGFQRAQDAAKADATALRRAQADLQARLVQQQQQRVVVEASVGQEQKLLEGIQARFNVLHQQPPATFTPDNSPLQDCPASGAPGGSNGDADAKQAAIYSAWPFGPVNAIPPGLEAVGPPSVEVASWYGDCGKGEGTAMGAAFNLNLFTNASLKFPLGTFLLVSLGGRSVLSLDNDHGPYVSGRTVDMSLAGAKALGFVGSGVATVTVQVVRPAQPPAN